jgi:hypothetical protein
MVLGDEPLMIKYLTSSQISTKVKHLLKDGGCAVVAYIGRSASKALPNNNITLLCDFDSVGTNPEEVFALKKKNFNVRKIKNLYAKVYCSSLGAIVGSANLSSNGLEFYEGVQAGLIEAAVFISPNERAYQDIQKWCEEKVRESKKIGDSEIDKKIVWWRAQDRHGRGSWRRKKDTKAANVISKQSITKEDILKYPDKYFFALWTEESEIKARTEKLIVNGQPIVMREFQQQIGSNDFMEDPALYGNVYKKRLANLAAQLHKQDPIFINVRAIEKNNRLRVNSNARMCLSKFKAYHPHEKRKEVLMFFDTREPNNEYLLSKKLKKELVQAFAAIKDTEDWGKWSDGKFQNEWWGSASYLTGGGFKKLLNLSSHN